MIEMTMAANIAKRAIPLYSAKNAVSLLSPQSFREVSLATATSVALPPVRWHSLCNSIPTSSAPPHLRFLKGKVFAHDPSESDTLPKIPPEIPSVPAYSPSFPPEVPELGNIPSEMEPVGPEILPNPVPQKPPLEPPGGPEFPVPPMPSPPGPDIPMPPPPDTVPPPPPPPDVVPPKPPEIVPPPPNMPPDITPPTGPFAAVLRGTDSLI